MSFGTSIFCVCDINSIFVTSDSLPAPSILYICRYLPEEFNLIFSISSVEFTSVHNPSAVLSILFESILFTLYLYFLTPVVIVALLVSLVNSLSPSKPFT